MKRQLFIRLFSLLIGMFLIGCQQPTDDDEKKTKFEGTWVAIFPNDIPVEHFRGKSAEMIFSENKWMQKIDGQNYAKGLFSFDNVNMTQKVTHMYQIDTWVEESFPDNIVRYQLDGNVLTFFSEQGEFSLTRK
jgi:hypothetical protein